MQRILKREELNIAIFQKGWRYSWKKDSDSMYLDFSMPKEESKKLDAQEYKTMFVQAQQGKKVLFKSYLCKAENCYFIAVANYVPLTIKAGKWSKTFDDLQMPVIIRYDVLPAEEESLEKFIVQMEQHDNGTMDEYAAFQKEMGYIELPSEEEMCYKCMKILQEKKIGKKEPQECEIDSRLQLQQHSIDDVEFKERVSLAINMTEYGGQILQEIKKKAVIAEMQYTHLVLEVSAQEGVTFKELFEDTLFAQTAYEPSRLEYEGHIVFIPRSDVLCFELLPTGINAKARQVTTTVKVTTKILVVVVPETASSKAVMREYEIPVQYLEESILHMLYRLKAWQLL